VFGCGTLRIDSVGQQAAEMRAVPHVQQVQTTLYELIEADRELRGDDEDVDVEEEPEISGARTGLFRRLRAR